MIERLRRSRLFDDATIHHHDTIRHGHRLDLVVCDVDGRRRQQLVQPLDLRAHLHAKLGIEVRQRLVEEKDFRVPHDRTPHRDALALAARKLARALSRAAR